MKAVQVRTLPVWKSARRHSEEAAMAFFVQAVVYLGAAVLIAGLLAR